ncbi:hypothetical protein [Oceanobacillus picturae]|nr:hypothetical protein [Oceanobacillus picturae]
MKNDKRGRKNGKRKNLPRKQFSKNGIRIERDRPPRALRKDDEDK